MAAQRRHRVEMDADGEQDIARLRQLAQGLALDADEGARRRLDVAEAHRTPRGAVDALDIRQRMVERVAGLDRPVEALDRIARLQHVEHAVDQPGIARPRPEARHRLVDRRHRPAEFFDQPPRRGKAQRAGGKPPAVLAAPHDDQVLLHQQRGAVQGGQGALAGP